jgi:hypothetical protein
MSSGVEASAMAPDSTARDSSTSLGMTKLKLAVQSHSLNEKAANVNVRGLVMFEKWMLP